LRDIDTGAPVTRDTVFPICSVTKSFTATAIALLVDEGLLDWDTPVRTILPEFRLRDTVATEQASLRDLLTHRTGLPRHDWVHMGGHLDNAGILAALRHLEPSKPFRSTWQYNNLAYLVAGLMLERVSAERWDDFVRTRILLPLGMQRATTSLEDMLARHPDCAIGHAVLDDEQRRIPLRLIYARPAGSICASIAEMAARMRFHLAPVTGLGSLRLSPAAATKLAAPQIYAGSSDFIEIDSMHYGFGFFAWQHRGARCVGHGGGPWCGYNCDLRLLPDHGSGNDERPRSRLCAADQHGFGPSVGAGAAPLARPVRQHPNRAPAWVSTGDRAPRTRGGATRLPPTPMNTPIPPGPCG
jgi:CubicO group peptidase (beta-lactamase class C family)